MDNHEYEHLFGWMRKNPTWAREIAAIDRMRAEIAGIAQEGFAWQSRAKKAEDERDRLRELLRDIHTYGIDGLHVGHPLRNRIDAELAKEKKE